MSRQREMSSELLAELARLFLKEAAVAAKKHEVQRADDLERDAVRIRRRAEKAAREEARIDWKTRPDR